MLSIYTLKSASEASKYYQQGDYYATEATDDFSHWLGKAADVLGLEGKVDCAIFQGLLEGRLPTGETMIQTKTGKHHRPGYDMTFSAPKSVSILALVAKNEEVRLAHQEAVKETFSKIEEQYACYRAKRKGEIMLEKTDNILVAAFEHYDSREGDPQLHTHGVLMNMTQRQDGAWRTLYADELYTDKLLNGMEYRSLLANKLLNLGYELTYGPKGTFEIKGVSPYLMNTFSKRRQQIKSWLDEKDVSGGEAAKVANFKTRKAKHKKTLEGVESRWIQELDECGSTLDELNKIAIEAKERGPISLPDPYLMADASVQSALDHLSERKTNFSLKDVMTVAKGISLCPGNDADFLKIIESKLNKAELIYIGEGKLTTPKVTRLENENALSMQEGQGAVNPILRAWVSRFVAKRTLTSESERQALQFILSHKDQQILFSSNSKDQLNTVLKVVNSVCEDQKYYPRLLISKAQNSDTMKQLTGIDRVSGLDEFIFSCEARGEAKENNSRLRNNLERLAKSTKDWQAREVWIVQADPSLKQINQLQHWAKVFSARIIYSQASLNKNQALNALVKDGIAHRSILNRAGNPYVNEKDFTTLLKNLDNQKNIISIPEHSERMDHAVKLWLEQKEQEKALLTLTRHDSFELNQGARKGLVKQGALSNQTTAEILSPITLSAAQKKVVSSYQLGDTVHFKRNNGKLIVKGDYYSIQRIDVHRGLIELHTIDKAVWWDPAQSKASHFELFKSETRAIGIGEKIRWTKTFKDKNQPHFERIKNQSATIVAINNQTTSVRLQNGEMLTLGLSKMQERHWDYDYARCIKEVPDDLKSGIIALNSRTIDFNHSKSLQGILKNIEPSPFTLVCDNKQRLLEQVEKVDSEWRFKGAVPYERGEALRDHQTVATLPIFHRLQTAYLEVLKFNPDLNRKQIIEEPNYSPQFRKAADIVDHITLKYSERDAVFSLEEAKKAACLYGSLQVPSDVIREAFDVALAKGWLEIVKHTENKSGTVSHDVLVTTKAMLCMEKHCVETMLKNQNVLIPIVDRESHALKSVQDNFWLTQGQKEAITLTVTSSDRFIGIQGVAGAGKTTALKEINRLCSDANYSVLVVANTASAKNRAIEASGITAMTTRQFLTRTGAVLKRDPEQAKLLFGGNRLIVLDEASLASTQDLFKLQNVTEQLEARICLMGDVKQMGSIEAGRIFHTLIAYGLKTAVMGENVRFKDPNTVSIMQDIYAARIHDAIDKLSDSILEIPDKTEALQKIVEIYCASKREVQDQTLIITPLNKDRVFINNAIREELNKTGLLNGNPLNSQVLLPKDFHQVDKTQVSSYEVNDYIRFNNRDKRSGIEMGTYARVIVVDPDSHRLILRLNDGKEIYWAPKNLKQESDIEIYRAEQREWLQNEVVIFKRNNEPEGIYNGDKAKILKIEGNTVELLLSSGKTLPLDLSLTQNQHLDYGYTVTAYPAQGRDVPFVLAYGECPRSYTKKTEELKVGDSIILTKEDVPNPKNYSETSKVATINKIMASELTLNDRYGYTYTVKAEPGRSWGYFPPFETRKAQEIPKSTSQQSFLMEVSRGDLTFLVVNNVDDYRKTLLSQDPKEGVLKHLDPLWPIRADMVEGLTAKMTGKAKPEKNIETSVDSEPTIAIQQNKAIKQNIGTTVFPANFSYVKGSRIDAEEVNRRLEGNLLGHATAWLGKPTRVTSREARWGRNGSFSLLLVGEKTGAWCNFENGESGKDLIALYASIHGIRWKDALKELAKGGGSRVQEKLSPALKLTQSPEKDPKARIGEAKKIYEQGVPIRGTLAQKYLHEFRAIPGLLPEDFRFKQDMIHPFTRKITPALLVPIRDKNRQIVGVESIFLDKNGDKLKGTFMRNGVEEKIISKVSFGIKKGGMVTVQESVVPRVLWIAEGVETALSVAKAMPNHTVVASLSAQQLKYAPVNKEVQKIIICADNDGANASSQKAVIKAIGHHLSEGRQVYLAMPSGPNKQDFNDLMKQGGVDAVRQSLEKMIEIKDTKVLENMDLNTFMKNARVKAKLVVPLEKTNVRSKVELER